MTAIFGVGFGVWVFGAKKERKLRDGDEDDDDDDDALQLMVVRLFRLWVFAILIQFGGPYPI